MYRTIVYYQHSLYKLQPQVWQWQWQDQPHQDAAIIINGFIRVRLQIVQPLDIVMEKHYIILNIRFV